MKFEGYDVTQAEWMDKEDLPEQLVLDFEKKLAERKMTTLSADVVLPGVEVETEDARLHPLQRRFPTLRPRMGYFVERPVLLHIERRTMSLLKENLVRVGASAGVVICWKVQK